MPATAFLLVRKDWSEKARVPAFLPILTIRKLLLLFLKILGSSRGHLRLLSWSLVYLSNIWTILRRNVVPVRIRRSAIQLVLRLQYLTVLLPSILTIEGRLLPRTTKDSWMKLLALPPRPLRSAILLLLLLLLLDVSP
jgi:hypothetical protein